MIGLGLSQAAERRTPHDLAVMRDTMERRPWTSRSRSTCLIASTRPRRLRPSAHREVRSPSTTLVDRLRGFVAPGGARGDQRTERGEVRTRQEPSRPATARRARERFARRGRPGRGKIAIEHYGGASPRIVWRYRTRSTHASKPPSRPFSCSPSLARSSPRERCTVPIGPQAFRHATSLAGVDTQRPSQHSLLIAQDAPSFEAGARGR